MGIEGTGWIKRKGKGVGGVRESNEVKEGKGGRWRKGRGRERGWECQVHD